MKFQAWQPFVMVILFLGGVIFSIYLLSKHINFDMAHNKEVVITDIQQRSFKEVNCYRIKIQTDTLNTPLPDPHRGEVWLDLSTDLFFNYHTRFLVWLYLICILVGLSWILMIPVLSAMKKVVRRYQISWFTLIFSFLWSILILGFAVILSSGLWLGNQWFSEHSYFLSFFPAMESFGILLNEANSVSRHLMILSNITSILAICGIYLVNSVIPSIEKKFTTSKELVKRFNELNKWLDLFLVILAILVSGGVITAIFNREMIIQALPGIGELIAPQEFVFLYSMGFTLFLALIYLPVYFQLKQKGRKILGDIKAKNPLGTASDHDKKKDILTKDDLTQISDILLLKHSTATNLKISLSILGPILSSVVSSLGII